MWVAILPVLVVWFSPGQASVSSASDLVAAVNDLRTANGRPLLQVNSALMAAAQQQSDFQAAVGYLSHTGEGGSRPRDRAAANGYGGDRAFYVSENIATGQTMTAQRAVEIWQGDSTHLNTMLGSNYQDIGAGYAAAGDRVFFTMLVGYLGEGAAASSTDQAATAVPANISATATSGTPEKVPVVTSTPGADGSVVHIVQQGQTLWDIAINYGLNIADLMSLNNLNQNSVIYPGWKLVIQRADRTPTGTPPDTSTPRPPPPTREPTRTPAPSPTRSPQAAARTPETGLSETATAVASVQELVAVDVRRDPLLIIIGVLVVAGIGLVLAGSLLKRGG